MPACTHSTEVLILPAATARVACMTNWHAYMTVFVSCLLSIYCCCSQDKTCLEVLTSHLDRCCVALSWRMTTSTFWKKFLKRVSLAFISSAACWPYCMGRSQGDKANMSRICRTVKSLDSASLQWTADVMACVAGQEISMTNCKCTRTWSCRSVAF